MISAFFKALGDLPSPRFRSVLLQCVGLSLLTAIALWALIAWLLASTELIGTLPWVGDALETVVDVLGNIAAFFLMILLLPAFLGIFAGLYVETICRAVEERHYPHLEPPRDQSITEGVVVGLKFAVYLIVMNLLLLVLIFFPPVYLVAGWVLNGILLGREYLEMVGFRRMEPRELREFCRKQRSTIFFSGLILAMLASIPLINLLLPLYGTSMLLHVFENARHKTN
jgi:CysZ protein